MAFRKRKQEVELSEQEVLMKQLIDAKRDLRVAESNFNTCDPDFFEIANAELTLATQRVQVVAQKLRKVSGESDAASANFELFSKIVC